MRPATASETNARAIRHLAGLLAPLFLAACAALPPGISSRLDALLPADVILIGEQHDAPEHQALQQAAVAELARRGNLAALAIEMAEQGRSTTGLPADATELQVRDALVWADAGWSWTHYGPVVMAAVRAGVPVLGANLPRSAMRAAMGNAQWDRQLAADALAQQHEDIRTGHCDLLPAAQIVPMARIQIARDGAMAATLVSAVQSGKVVLLVAGAGHVVRTTGVPSHLPARLATRVVLQVAGDAVEPRQQHADVLWRTAPTASKDYCASLRRSMPTP